MSHRNKLLVLNVAALSADMAGRLRVPGLTFRPMQTVFPAVTCTVQASFRTALPPVQHGVVANGLYHHRLRRVLFWEQAASLVEGPRIWGDLRARGGKVGLMFWQQSIGESADLIVSPKPVHKHSGGMIQDVYTQPHDLYDRLCAQVGRRFNLMHYWGPMASRKSSEWIADAICAVMDMPDVAPDLLLAYLPHLDYDLQRYGPEHQKIDAAIRVLQGLLTRLVDHARSRDYDVLLFGDYAIRTADRGAVFPNRALRDAGLFSTRRVKGMHYPDFFASKAFAMVDHEIAHVYVPDRASLDRARDVLASLGGVGEVMGRVHAGGGDLILVAADGYWFAYPWWTDRKEAPDFAAHVDIHNKPGFDPCELFFGWPPGSVSRDADRVRGSHGRTGPGREVAWAATCDLGAEPENLIQLSQAVMSRLNSQRPAGGPATGHTRAPGE